MALFPDADPQYLEQQCQTFQTEEFVLSVVTELLECADYHYSVGQWVSETALNTSP
jgi:hypothetical protein